VEQHRRLFRRTPSHHPHIRLARVRAAWLLDPLCG
jgi:hypothetical protein